MKDDDRPQRKRGGARPAAGRPRSCRHSLAPKGVGRGGARAGAGRKGKLDGITAAELRAVIDAAHGECEVDALFAHARSGDAVALRRIVKIFEEAAPHARALGSRSDIIDQSKGG